MKLGDVWFSAIAEAENSDRMIVVSGRTEIEPFIQSGKFKERVEITWKYEADSKGMPNETTGIRTYAQRNSRSVRNVTSHHLYRERPRMERISGNVRASRSG